MKRCDINPNESMREFNFRNVTLMAAAASCFIQIGAQLFAVSVIARTVAQAPPRSFAIFEGAYGYDSSSFWNTAPPITALLLVIALATNWKTQRRNLLLIAMAVWTFSLFAGAALLAALVRPATNGARD
jgi:hypothetical protein